MRRTFLVLPTALTAAAVALTGAVVAQASSVPHGRGSLRVYNTSTHIAVAPATAAPGIVHLRNIGRDTQLVLAPKHASDTRRTAVADLKHQSPAPLLHDFRFLGEAVPGQDSYLRISPGTLYFVDVETMDLKPSKIAETTVGGNRVDARVPSSRRVLVTKHKSLYVPHRLPQAAWLRVMNRSSALGEFLFIGVDRKATYRALHNLTAHPTLEKLFRFLSFNLLTLSDVGPHSTVWQHFEAPSGRYIAAVLVFGDGGQPSLHRGQVRIMHVGHGNGGGSPEPTSPSSASPKG